MNGLTVNVLPVLPVIPVEANGYVDVNVDLKVGMGPRSPYGWRVSLVPSVQPFIGQSFPPISLSHKHTLSLPVLDTPKIEVYIDVMTKWLGPSISSFSLLPLVQPRPRRWDEKNPDVCSDVWCV